MELTKNIIAHDIFLYLRESKAFVISDIHVGFEENLNNKGILIPRAALGDLISRIEQAILEITKNDKIEFIVINGDILHSFSGISLDEKYALSKIIKFLVQFGKVIIIKGNHDTVLDYVISKGITVVKKIILGDILIIHGDAIIDIPKSVKTVIIGHDHPSISISSGIRHEKYKCFLVGKYKGKDLIVMPSANTLVEGSDISKEKFLSPYIKNMNSFKVYVTHGKIYDFGKLKDLLS